MSHEARLDSLEIQNVVASSAVGQELDLASLSMDVTGAEFNPDNFPGLVYRTQEPRAANLIFRSGKIVCTGASSVNEVNQALNKVFEELGSLGIPTDNREEATIQNIVSSADLGTGLNLNALAIGLGLESVEYEPEQFPGLVYRLDEPNVVVLLFGSGKIVITGAKKVDYAREAIEVVSDEIDSLGLLG
ncbi:TATA-box-binding protein [Haloferax profundi]|uniref:TATA-box-binding protein n=1 Tax=Haloferax profundi TaxID=1544718 RepID=A0A0W1R5S5_9EURY|nr:TATA-box-binding protein [Haloferax profundi]KTG08745.1 transcription factor [Haloferax profundi]